MDLRYFGTDRAAFSANYHARIVAALKVGF